MARALEKLSARKAETVQTAGKYGDGGGLYLIVDASGAKRWVFMFRWKDHQNRPGSGRLREMGLGSFNAVSLKAARERARHARELLSEGKDPIAAKRAKADIPTFGEVADEWVATRSREGKSDKSEARWKRCLEVYSAALRPLRIDMVTTADVLAVLKPIWVAKNESAAMTRGYIERVLDAAKARGLRAGENPALWKGHLDHLLPKRTKLTRGNHPALPYADIPKFMDDLRSRKGLPVLALEFTILTAARTSQTLDMTWSEVNEDKAVWTVPATRMKAKREHRVPLTARALAILEEAKAWKRGDDLVFPGRKEGSPLSQMAMAMLMRRMERSAYTVHGFRSTFRDWCGEETEFAGELAEAALAHALQSATEAAYRRGDGLRRRTALMDEWSAYCAGEGTTENTVRQPTAA